VILGGARKDKYPRETKNNEREMREYGLHKVTGDTCYEAFEVAREGQGTGGTERRGLGGGGGGLKKSNNERREY